MKRTMNRLLIRFSLLCLAIILGAIAVAQAQRGFGNKDQVAAADILPKTNAPIPFNKNPTWNAASEPVQPAQAAPIAVEQTAPTYQEAQFTQEPAAEEFQPIAPPTYDAPQFEQPEFEQPAVAQIEQPEYVQPEFAAPEFDPPQPQFTEPQFTEPEYTAPEQPVAQPEYAAPEFDQQQTTFVGQETYNPPPANPTRSLQPQVPEIQTPAAPTFPEPRVASSAASTERYIPPSEPAPSFTQELPAQESRQVRNTPPQFATDQALLRPMHSRTEAVMNGNGKPGTSDLEGAQAPTLSIVKEAPEEVQVGKQADLVITIRNTGSTTAREVSIRDQIPAGARLESTSPPANHSGDELVWQIGELNPGEEQVVSMTIVPTAEGDIGSVAQVYFAAAASAKSRCTRPQINIEHTGPRQVLVGEDVIFKIKLHNSGTGIAHNVVVEEDVPLGLRHSAGKELEFPVGNLRPGETRLLELTLKADKPGQVNNVLLARADANLNSEHAFNFEVIAPLLQVGIQGPKRRYLDREATFDIAVQNPGTANADGIDLVAHLPRGLQFERADNQGEYDPQTHTVHWTLAQLPANEMGTVRITAIPTDMGDQKIRVEGKANMNLTDSAEHVVLVDGLAALLYTVKDLSDPVEVGKSTTYEVTVVNQGSKAATNLRLAAQAPVGLQPVSGEGPTRAEVRGQTIRFDALPKLAPQGETKYRVNVSASQPGDMRLTFYLVSDEVTEPITKEESTHVYSDE